MRRGHKRAIVLVVSFMLLANPMGEAPFYIIFFQSCRSH